MDNTVGFIQRLELGQPNGVAALDEIGVIKSHQLPNSINAICEAETDEEILAGMPIYLKSNGHLARASVSTSVLSQVVGCAIASSLPGFAASYAISGAVTCDDWSAVSPTKLLKVGQIYYLDVNLGRITNIPPESGYLVVLGRAINQNAIALNIQQSILL